MHDPTRTHNLTRQSGITALLFLGHFGLQLALGLCFREGGVHPANYWPCFIGGNIFGITSTALLMGVYARMNVNLAMLLASSGTFLLTQLVFWQLFHTPLTGLQGAGILLIALGIALASRMEESNTVPVAVEQPEGATRESEEVHPC
ncbi:MAG TPA: hypothetical protein VGM23_01710 [Armatimonadota bacterium]|jgi:drug/metabolite transporter (DMT)-like permease